MYRRNASLHHLPMIIIVRGDTPARYIIIKALERRECAPIYMGTKPNCPLPRIWTAACNFVLIPAEVMENLFPFVSMKVLTLRFVGGSVPLYDQTHVTVFFIGGLGRNTGDLICTC